MSLPNNITKEHLFRAIQKIDNEGVPKDGESRYYNVQYNGKDYPPKLVVAYANIYANGAELDRNTFEGGIDTPCFKLLENNGLKIVQKNMKQTYIPKKYWIEKTIVTGRPDRNEGERALGKALWSPQKSKDGSDIYKNMRLVQKGDIILHLINNKCISGISIVKEEAIETNGVEGTEWDGPAYLIELDDYTELLPAIDRNLILNERYRNELLKIANSSEVFFNSKLDLRQGAYLTPCSNELLSLINDVYFKVSDNNLPHVDGINFKILATTRMAQINQLNKAFLEETMEAGLIFSPQLIQRFIASLCTKPFVICSGLSGSGKTKLAQAFAEWISEDKSQFLIVPVGADWTNREPLLGYPNALNKNEYVFPENGVLELLIKARENYDNKNIPTKPYFLILDEMNLSHVERYFADFLSTMESEHDISLHKINGEAIEVPQSLQLPGNLFIIGTVNIDETTYMFSPKVLDRANTIEFRIGKDELDSFLKSSKPLNMSALKAKGASMSDSFMDMALQDTETNFESVKNDLLNFFVELKKAGAEFGYRTTSEMGRLMQKLKLLGAVGDDLLDIAIMQKLLPKLHGSRSKLTKVLPVLAGFCLKASSTEARVLMDKYNSEILENTEQELIKYKLSFDKICRMYKNAIENGFASYAEA
jgi:5-methylcytosine-specific restriction protein B